MVRRCVLDSGVAVYSWQHRLLRVRTFKGCACLMREAIRLMGEGTSQGDACLLECALFKKARVSLFRVQRESALDHIHRGD